MQNASRSVAQWPPDSHSTAEDRSNCIPDLGEGCTVLNQNDQLFVKRTGRVFRTKQKYCALRKTGSSLEFVFLQLLAH